MIETDTLLCALTAIHDFSVEEKTLISGLASIQTFKKNEFLLNAGEVCRYLYFIEKGLLRTFHLNANGSEFTRLIVPEQQFCTVLLSFQEGIPSPAFIQALENGTLMKISHAAFKTITEKSEAARFVYTKILEDFQNFQIKRIEFLTQWTPQEKTKHFLQENPKLATRLTSKVIASYLQITPETYSRCRKNLLS